MTCPRCASIRSVVRQPQPVPLTPAEKARLLALLTAQLRDLAEVVPVGQPVTQLRREVSHG